jgi:hypothetical protein
METTKKAFSPRIETDWMSDPSVSLQDHIDRVASFDYATMDPALISRHQAHEANIQQKEIRRSAIHSNRKAVIAHRALVSTVEV